MTGSEDSTAGSFGRLDAEPHEVEEARVHDSTAGRRVAGPPSPTPYVVPALGLPSLVSRRKYGWLDSGPFVVTVQPCTLDAHSSASASHRVEEAVSPFARAIAGRADQSVDLRRDGVRRVAALVLPALLR